MRGIPGIVLALSVAAAGGLQAQSTMVDINSSASLTNSTYGASAIGWYFTPSTSFFLTAIKTQFNRSGTTTSRTVLAELWTDRPGNGGTLIRSGAFDSDDAVGQFGGGSFASFLMQAGVQYFIGFRNVEGLGRNTTDLFGSQSLGYAFFSVGDPNLATYGTTQNINMTYNPAMLLEGYPTTTTPEPVTMALMATGLVGVGGATWIRRRRNARSS